MKLFISLILLLNIIFITKSQEIYTSFKITGDGCGEDGAVIPIDTCSNACGTFLYVDYNKETGYNIGSYTSDSCDGASMNFKCTDQPAMFDDFEIECINPTKPVDYISFNIIDGDCSLNITSKGNCTKGPNSQCNFYYFVEELGNGFEDYVIVIFKPVEGSTPCDFNDKPSKIYSDDFECLPDKQAISTGKLTITCYNTTIDSTPAIPSNSSSDSNSDSSDTSSSSIIKYSLCLFVSLILFIIL